MFDKRLIRHPYFYNKINIKIIKCIFNHFYIRHKPIAIFLLLKVFYNFETKKTNILFSKSTLSEFNIVRDNTYIMFILLFFNI